jgi:hypothetical protein
MARAGERDRHTAMPAAGAKFHRAGSPDILILPLQGLQ